MTGRQLIERIVEHHRPKADKPVYMHFSTCTEYQKQFREYQDKQGQTVTATNAGKPLILNEISLNFFKEQFCILKKNFRSFTERRTAEAYFIRTLRPDLNGQNEHKFFKLFWLWASLFLT